MIRHKPVESSKRVQGALRRQIFVAKSMRAKRQLAGNQRSSSLVGTETDKMPPGPREVTPALCNAYVLHLD